MNGKDEEFRQNQQLFINYYIVMSCGVLGRKAGRQLQERIKRRASSCLPSFLVATSTTCTTPPIVYSPAKNSWQLAEE